MRREDLRGYIIKKEDGSELVNYNSDDFPSYVHAGCVFPDATWANVTHYHDDLEFVTITQGEMAYNVNGKITRLYKGDTLMVNKGQLHYSMVTTEEECDYILCIFQPRLLSSSYVVEKNYVSPITDTKSIEYVYLPAKSPYGKKMFEAVSKMYSVWEDVFNLSIEFMNMWRIIFDYCNESNLIKHDAASDNGLDCIKNMIAFIQNSYTENLTLNDIAEAGNISKTYCIQMFKKYTGQTPIENLLRFRCRKVKDYLDSTDLSMGMIAEKTGFSGPSYMAETFKKYYHTTPGAYRKTQRN